MLKGKIIGNIVSTRKKEALVGSKFMEVQLIKNNVLTDEYIVAVDSVGAGIGETVLLTTGSSARLALTDATRQTIRNGLDMLGLQAPERM